MCLFPLPNYLFNSEAFQKGVTEFPCGACPECLQSRSNKIMLRDVFEASTHQHNCMCTLTYDTYIRDESGHIVGEKLNLRKVNVSDCQKFIKRLRIYVQRHYGVNFKYRLSAEYGKKTHRPHYHVLFFGWTFPDVVKYKKSKRGNWIYVSHILTKLWTHGICTVDSIRVTPAIAKYCSKYTSKDHGAEDTFSLCSHGIGIEPLYKKFNGLYYVVEGKKYSIPREVWQRYINDCYLGGSVAFDNRYVNMTPKSLADGSYAESVRLRAAYRFVRDNDPLYQAYLKYWSFHANTWKILQSSVFDRIRALSEDKYHFYKLRALEILELRNKGIPAVAPRSGCKSAYFKYLYGSKYAVPPVICPQSSRLNRANDTFSKEWFISRAGNVLRRRKIPLKISILDNTSHVFNEQMSFFDKNI